MKNRYLIPIKILEKQSLSPGIIEFLSGNEVVLLGYHILPDQTPLGQASEQFSEEVEKKLTSIQKVLEEKNVEVEKKIVFTHNEEETVDRIASEEDIDGVLLPNPSMKIKKILIVLTDPGEIDEISLILDPLVRDEKYDLTPVYLGEDVGDTHQELVDYLNKEGMEISDLSTKPMTESELLEEVGNYDLIIMGDVKRKLLDIFSRELAKKIADKSLGPVLVTLGRENKLA